MKAEAATTIKSRKQFDDLYANVSSQNLGTLQNMKVYANETLGSRSHQAKNIRETMRHGKHEDGTTHNHYVSRGGQVKKQNGVFISERIVEKPETKKNKKSKSKKSKSKEKEQVNA